MNISQENINFKIARDFGETFNISVKFLRQNFSSFFICLLFLAGPFILSYSLILAHYDSVIIDKTALVKAGLLYNIKIYNWEYFLSLLLQILSYLSIICTTYSYMIVYSEKGKGNFTVADVAKKMNAHIGKITGGFLLYSFLTTIFIVALVYIIGMIGNSSNFFGVLMVILIFIGILLVGPNLLWQINTVFLVILIENEIPLSAYGRTREVMKDNFWWTWLLVVCGLFTISLLSVLFLLPSYLYTLINYYGTAESVQETSILYIIVSAVCTFLGTITNSIFYVISTFHYYSLAEKKDGKGLLERINEIGISQKNITEQQF